MAAIQTHYSRILQFESAMAKRLGLGRMQRYSENYAYYTGDNLPPQNVEQPLGVNYVATFNNKHTHYLFGQFDRDIVGWAADPVVSGDKPTDDERALARKITRHVYQLAHKNDANTLFYEAGLNGSIYGDIVFRCIWDKAERRVRWESVVPEYVHFRWSPHDLNRIEEAVISYPIDRDSAERLYGSRGNPRWGMVEATETAMQGMAVYWEFWTAWLYEVYIDDQLVSQEPNPCLTVDSYGNPLPGIVPLVHIPNIRAGGEFYGFGDAEGIRLLQDDLNRKLADQGDIVANFAHPITIVNKYYGDVEELPVGPDQIWDLGREGEAKILEWRGDAPAVREFIQTIMEVMLDLGSMSSVAFGKHKGSQQSATALAIEMLPVTERARWKRMLWSVGLRKLIQMSVLIESRQGDVPLGFTYEELLAHNLNVIWAPILPRDRMALLNENIALVSSHLRSIERALEELGEDDPDEELQRILENVRELIKSGLTMQGIAATGTPTGSSALPEGASSKGRPVGS